MRIITISREFGSGGRELGKRLADILHYDYYDKEILAEMAKNSGLDASYIENAMTSSFPLTFSRSFSINAYSTKTNLMIEEKRIIEEIAKKGRNFVIVGRNADVLLKNYQPFNLFVCANLDSKITRCLQRAPKDENLTKKEIEYKMKQIDQSRKKYRQIVTGSPWGHVSEYHMTINTSYWNIKELANVMADVIVRYFE